MVQKCAETVLKASECRIRDVEVIWPEMFFHNRNCVFINDDNRSNNDNNNDNDNENTVDSNYKGVFT